MKVFKCQYCPYKAGKEGKVQFHVRKVHENWTIEEKGRCLPKCEICKKTFKYLRELAIHYEENDSCRWPKKSKKTSKKNHPKNSKNDAPIEQLSKLSSKIASPIECQICQKTFAKPSRLEIHIQAFHKDKNHFTCDQCGDKYLSEASLKTHITSVHDGIKHVCNGCGGEFVSSVGLNIHQVRCQWMKINQITPETTPKIPPRYRKIAPKITPNFAAKITPESTHKITPKVSKKIFNYELNPSSETEFQDLSRCNTDIDFEDDTGGDDIKISQVGSISEQNFSHLPQDIDFRIEKKTATFENDNETRKHNCNFCQDVFGKSFSNQNFKFHNGCFLP